MLIKNRNTLPYNLQSVLPVLRRFSTRDSSLTDRYYTIFNPRPVYLVCDCVA